MTTTRRRPVFSICPPWCAGHEGLFQPWETLVDGVTLERDHDSHAGQVGPVGLYAAQRQTLEGMEPARVRIYVDSHADDSLTPAQARDLAAMLTTFAEQVEAHA